jgi:hypothetical protein
LYYSRSFVKQNLGNRLASHIFATEWLQRQN